MNLSLLCKLCCCADEREVLVDTRSMADMVHFKQQGT